jgi:hypothetical protein
MSRQDGTKPLIPAANGLTELVLANLEAQYGAQITAIGAELEKKDIESFLSRVRSLSKVIGPAQIHGLDGPGYHEFSKAICVEIGKLVDVRLPKSPSPYSELIQWITGAARAHAVEIFTTNYDLLFEEAFEAVKVPYFDGFTGGREPFFDPVSVARNDLPPRWTRLWKLHGSLGWQANSRDEVIRTGKGSASHLVFPEHLKYDQTQKAPYAAYLDRLRAFLETPDTLLIGIGFSFSDAHISSRIDEALAGNPSASLFAFQFNALSEEAAACALATRLPNFSVYARDKAMVNGIPGAWSVPSELPNRDWGPIRASYWGVRFEGQSPEFLLGDVEYFCRFFAAARSTLVFSKPLEADPTPQGQAAGVLQ